MKNARKLIPALAMLLVSAILMTTASFAWFSMNTSVTASGMQVTANTDNAYLIISAGTTLSGKEKSATGTMDAELYPTKPVTTLTSANVGTPASWGTATSDDPDNANVSAVPTPLEASADLTKYVAKQSFKVGIVENSGTVANNLRMKSITISDTTDGITVVVVCGNNIYTYTANATTMTDVLAPAANVTATGVQVDVYVYIDGSNASVKTTNAANLAGTVTLEFTIDA